MSDATGMLALLVLLGVYLAPTLVALLRRKRNALAIGALNLFFGWTVLGWFGALIWALTVDAPTPGERR